MDITNTIGYYLRPNPTDTAAQAPYLPKLVPNGVANLNDVAEKIAGSLPVSAERAKLIIRESFTESVAAALLGYTVDMGALRMKARIPGSMPCEDTPFDPEANACVIELYADGELADAFDALKPVKLTAAQLANAVKVSNVMDVETEKMGEIRGTGEFMVLGNGVTLDAAGESAKLVDRKSGAELATAEVVTVSKGQRATCKFAAVRDSGGIAAGAYLLVITTFGLVGETTPRVFRKPVTLVEDIPESTDPYFLEPTGVFPIKEGATYLVPGGHLPAAEDWTPEKDSALNVTVKPSEDPSTHMIGVAQTGDLDVGASGPDGVSIKGDFLVDLFAEYELTPDPGREYPVELTGQIGETTTNTVAFTAKVVA